MSNEKAEHNNSFYKERQNYDSYRTTDYDLYCMKVSDAIAGITSKNLNPEGDLDMPDNMKISGFSYLDYVANYLEGLEEKVKNVKDKEDILSLINEIEKFTKDNVEILEFLDISNLDNILHSLKEKLNRIEEKLNRIEEIKHEFFILKTRQSELLEILNGDNYKFEVQEVDNLERGDFSKLVIVINKNTKLISIILGSNNANSIPEGINGVKNMVDRGLEKYEVGYHRDITIPKDTITIGGAAYYYVGEGKFIVYGFSGDFGGTPFVIINKCFKESGYTVLVLSEENKLETEFLNKLS